MDVKAKKKAILEARKSFSKMQLDPRGKGRNILSLERDEKISEAKINEIYENVLRLQGKTEGKGEVLDKQLDKVLDKVLDKQLDKVLDKEKPSLLDKPLDKIQERLQRLERTVQELDDTVNLILVKQKGLEDRLASLEAGSLAQEDKQKPKEKGKESQAKKLLGFAIVQKSTSSQGKQYQKWYAVKRMEGKQVWVYVGDKPEEAESKIKAWGEKQKANANT